MRTTAASRHATVFLSAALCAAITAALLACGPFVTDLATVQPYDPPHRTAYAPRLKPGIAQLTHDVNDRFRRAHRICARPFRTYPQRTLPPFTFSTSPVT